MNDLITLQRAIEAFPSFDESDNGVLVGCISAASEAVVKYCRVNFLQATYDELYHGTGTRSLFLNQVPVVSVAAVRYYRTNAIQIMNTDSANQSATAAVTATGLTLSRTKDAVTVNNTLTFAAYPTIGALGTAVTALANGWTASVPPPFSSWASADLLATQGAFRANQQQANLTVHQYWLGDWRLNPGVGEVWYSPGFSKGYENFRVTYTAGVAATVDNVPADLQAACAELAKLTYQYRTVNPSLQSESLGSYSYTRAAVNAFANLSPVAKQALDYYKVRRVPRWQA